MPSTSPYQVVLSDDERRHLEATARSYTSSYSEVVRARIVLYAVPLLVPRKLPGRPHT